MAVIMGIDYGTKRIGVAFSNAEEGMAFPEGIVENDTRAVSRICALAREHHAAKIVVGLPLTLNGEPTDATAGAREFAKGIGRETGLPVDFADERFTSAQARRTQDAARAVDASSAALILEHYLSQNGFMKQKMG